METPSQRYAANMYYYMYCDVISGNLVQSGIFIMVATIEKNQDEKIKARLMPGLLRKDI